MNQHMKKSIVLGVVLLFVMLSASSMVSASLFQTKDSEVEITVYQADGSTETSQFVLNQEKMQTLCNLALKGSENELLNCVVEFGLLDESFLQDEVMSSVDLPTEAKETLFQLDKIKAGLPVIVSPLSKVSSVTLLGGSKRIGVTPILRIVEKLLPVNLKRADVLATTTGLFGVVSTQNMLCNKALAGMFVGVIYLGFVGVSVKIPGLMHIFSGYAALTISSGVGLKSRNVKNIFEGLGQ